LLSLSISTPLGRMGTACCLRNNPKVENAKPHARRSSPGVLQAADMIRKTSLLRKIEPTTRRSSFVGKDRNTEAMQAKRSCANPGDYIAAPADCSADPLFGSISSLRCQKSRTPHPEGYVMRNDVPRTFKQLLPDGACCEHTG
jgi:hypothetical protein